MDKIKSQLTTAFMMFVFDFADPSQVKTTPPCKIQDLFNSQKNADKAKRVLGKGDFDKVLSLYFNQYQSKGGIDHDALSDSLAKNKKVMLRHIGRDKVNFLVLVACLLKNLDQPAPKRGLLRERESA